MNQGHRFSLTGEEIAFIGRPMADLLERSRKPLPLEERIRQQEEVERLIDPGTHGRIVNYDPRYGTLGQILSSL